MKSFTKFLVDIGPLAIFFIFYTRSDLQSAILPFMIATVIAVIFWYIVEKKIPIMPTVGAGIILVFGGLSLYFNNDSGTVDSTFEINDISILYRVRPIK